MAGPIEAAFGKVRKGPGRLLCKWHINHEPSKKLSYLYDAPK
jgi:hypothetical protein